MSKHTQTLLQLDLYSNDIGNDSAAARLISLCQNLTNVKVILVNNCGLENLSPNTVSSVVKAFTDCNSLQVLNMGASFSIATTTMIVDGLAQLVSLRYLGLNFPGDRSQSNLCKIFHGAINKCRHSPL